MNYVSKSFFFPAVEGSRFVSEIGRKRLTVALQSSYLFLSVTSWRKNGKMNSRKQTVQINKESLCRCRCHISSPLKERLTFITAAGPKPYFPRCCGEKIPFISLYRRSVTQKMPRECLSLQRPHFNWIPLKVQINLEGTLWPDTHLQPAFLCSWLKSLCVSPGCSSSCLDLLRIDSCFTSRRSCGVAGDLSQVPLSIREAANVNSIKILLLWGLHF